MNVETGVGRWRRMTLVLVLLLVATATVMADPVYYAETGNYYEFVGGVMDWSAARDMAESLSFEGHPGYLATITSPGENEFISSTFASGEQTFFAWLAGYEPEDDGVWLWGAGPEADVQFAQEHSPTPPYNYENWGPQEPNDNAVGEDYLAINLGAVFAGINPGEWIDSPNPNPDDPIRGLIVEYQAVASGMHRDGSRVELPRLVSLAAAPNPFNPSIEIRFSLRVAASVKLVVYDARGRLVSHLVDEDLQAGDHSARWNGQHRAGGDAASGTYIARIEAGREVLTRRITLIR